jgi:hypothetical protein
VVAVLLKKKELSDAGVELRLSGGSSETLDPASLRQGPDGALWCTVRAGRCPARFDNHAVSKMSDWIAEDEDGVYVSIAGTKVRPPEIADPLSLGLEKR